MRYLLPLSIEFRLYQEAELAPRLLSLHTNVRVGWAEGRVRDGA